MGVWDLSRHKVVGIVNINLILKNMDTEIRKRLPPKNIKGERADLARKIILSILRTTKKYRLLMDNGNHDNHS